MPRGPDHPGVVGGRCAAGAPVPPPPRSVGPATARRARAPANGPSLSTTKVADQVAVQGHLVGAGPAIGVRHPGVRVAVRPDPACPSAPRRRTATTTQEWRQGHLAAEQLDEPGAAAGLLAGVEHHRDLGEDSLRGLERRAQRGYSPLEGRADLSPHLGPGERTTGPMHARPISRQACPVLREPRPQECARPGSPRTTLRHVGYAVEGVAGPGTAQGVVSRHWQPRQDATCWRVPCSTPAGQDQPAAADLGVALVVAPDVRPGADSSGRACAASDGRRASRRVRQRGR